MSVYGQPQQHSCSECSVAAWHDASYYQPAPRGAYGQPPHQGAHLISPACPQHSHLNFASGAGPAQHKVLAERYKTKLCRNFVETGACPYEYRCMFAHGEHELRTTEMNLRDGLTTEDAIRHYKRIMQYKALEELAGIAQPPDYESTLTNNTLLDEAMRSPSGDDAPAAFGSSEWSGSRNGSIAPFKMSSQPSFEQLSAAPARYYQNNPYAWRSFDELADVANEAPQEASEVCLGEGGDACACAECLYRRAPSAQPSSRAPAGGPYRSPAIARTIAEHSRRSTRPCPEPVYLRAPSFDAAAYAEVQMP